MKFFQLFFFFEKKQALNSELNDKNTEISNYEVKAKTL